MRGRFATASGEAELAARARSSALTGDGEALGEARKRVWRQNGGPATLIQCLPRSAA